MILYHATSYENMRFILSHEEADPDFDEANGFKGGRVSGFEGCAFVSQKPLEFGCAGGTYHVAIEVADEVSDEYRYYDDDDNYNCRNYAIPVDILNRCDMWLVAH